MKRLRIFFAWYDLWIGAYYDRRHRTLYLCPLPMLVVEIDLCFKHEWLPNPIEDCEVCEHCGAERNHQFPQNAT